MSTLQAQLVRMKKNIGVLYGFSFFDRFMIVIPLLVPYLATKGISMQEFMNLQAVFAIVIVCGQLPTGLLSDLWGRKRTLLLGSVLKAISFSLLPFWSDYQGFLLYHIMMGLALSMISGGDVALLFESHIAAGGERSRGATVLANAQFTAQVGAAISALAATAIGIFSYRQLLWANALLGWVAVFIALWLAEPPASRERDNKPSVELKELLSTVFVRDTVTRLIFFNLVIWGVAGFVMLWTNQKYWEESGIPLACFGLLWAGYNLIVGFSGRLAAFEAVTNRPRVMLLAVGALPIVAYFAMASYVGWVGILFGMLIQVSRGLGQVLFQNALNERIPARFRATVMSAASMGIRASFSLVGPLVGHAIDSWGMPWTLSALGALFSVAFLFLLLPLALQEIPQHAGRSADRA